MWCPPQCCVFPCVLCCTPQACMPIASEELYSCCGADAHSLTALHACSCWFWGFHMVVHARQYSCRGSSTCTTCCVALAWTGACYNGLLMYLWVATYAAAGRQAFAPATTLHACTGIRAHHSLRRMGVHKEQNACVPLRACFLMMECVWHVIDEMLRSQRRCHRLLLLPRPLWAFVCINLAAGRALPCMLLQHIAAAVVACRSLPCMLLEHIAAVWRAMS